MLFKKKNSHERHYLLGSAAIAATLFAALSLQSATSNAAEAVQIRYNGKTVSNTSKKLPVTYNGKTVSKAGYKALKINKTYMIPYADVLKNGVKASCSYTSSGKKVTIKYNNNTLIMKVGSKSATLNSKKVTLSQAPLSVKFVAKNKTKILVPASTVANALGLTYHKGASAITLKDPLSLQYNNSNVTYHNVQGDIYYNHKKYTLSQDPVLKLGGKYYLPAKQVFDQILGWEYSENSASGTLRMENEDVSISISGTAGSDKIKINGTEVSLGSPIYSITNTKAGTSTIYVPAAAILKQAGYTRSWDSAKNCYSIQSQKFFSWQKTLTDAQKNSTTTNYIYDMEGNYSINKQNGTVKFKIAGSSSNLMSKLTVKREGKKITINMPSSSYLLNSNQFSNFGEIIEKMEVTSGTDRSVTITFTCKETEEYSYTLVDGVLELNILYTYSDIDSIISDYALVIPKPDGVKAADISNVDLYPNSKAFKIILKGNHTAALEKNPVIVNNNSAKSIAVTKNSSGNTVIKVKTSSLRGYKIFVKGDYIVVKMGAPKNIYKNIVVLDAGHGGYDPGAQNKGTNEKDLNYKIIYTLMKKHFSGNAPDIKVYWTRTTDKFITLADRAAFAKKVNADVFISLHMNSADNSSANGTEVYYSVSNNRKSFSGLTSKTMAALFKNRLIEDLNTKNRGTKTAAYYVLKHNTVPSILIELGFISGSTDYSKLTNSTFQKKAAQSIYNGIVSLFNSYSTGR